ncbi:CAP domain-containing protein [Nocardioides bizhenqiangii]|uniref:CAP domain-containing protein n=1 Tax=Nocardioides bizhenqiangii TaxID=3095076 RepID=A0ABZ0ZQ40_9ACTN|nr:MULTISPECIES: CAP domain-containing protein [unclassified Nocardioides]MDZ5619529.1 CAP domain-containing protein [Nocardioides sp. HM23]WQQ26454.1 CAP domain-containing protein [Nocardioides sp. HM61]
MRKVLAVLFVLAAALTVAPASTATSTPSGDGDRVDQARRGSEVQLLRQRVVTLTNNKRRARGCPVLRRNDALDRAAQTHTVKMAGRGRNGTLSHQLPGEPGVGTRLRRAGYDWSGWGENVAAGQTTARAVMRSWMNSRGHRRNILNCRFRHIGVGLAYARTGTPYWTQDFGYR